MSKKKASLVGVSGTGALSACTLRKLAASADEEMAAHAKSGVESPIARKKKLQQYHTDQLVVLLILEFLKDNVDLTGYLWVEPAAGDGAFSQHFPPGSLSFELDAQVKGIIKANFLRLRIRHDRVAVIGNPPFGQAEAFFNHAALQACVVAMILPARLKRKFAQRKLNRNFRLLKEMDLPAGAFLFDGKPCNVTAVFQIWVKREDLRPIPEWKTTHPDFQFVKDGEVDFVVRRVGVNAGHVDHDVNRSDGAHLFVRVRERRRVKDVEKLFKALPLNRLARITSSIPHLARAEIVAAYVEASYRRSCRSLVEDVDPDALAAQCFVIRRKRAVRPVKTNPDALTARCFVIRRKHPVVRWRRIRTKLRLAIS